MPMPFSRTAYVNTMEKANLSYVKAYEMYSENEWCLMSSYGTPMTFAQMFEWEGLTEPSYRTDDEKVWFVHAYTRGAGGYDLADISHVYYVLKVENYNPLLMPDEQIVIRVDMIDVDFLAWIKRPEIKEEIANYYK